MCGRQTYVCVLNALNKWWKRNKTTEWNQQQQRKKKYFSQKQSIKLNALLRKENHSLVSNWTREKIKSPNQTHSLTRTGTLVFSFGLHSSIESVQKISIASRARSYADRPHKHTSFHFFFNSCTIALCSCLLTTNDQQRAKAREKETKTFAYTLCVDTCTLYVPKQSSNLIILFRFHHCRRRFFFSPVYKYTGEREEKKKMCNCTKDITRPWTVNSEHWWQYIYCRLCNYMYNNIHSHTHWIWPKRWTNQLIQIYFSTSFRTHVGHWNAFQWSHPLLKCDFFA